MDDKKRTCVITGASAGIGKATAAEMARLGYSVVMLVRDCEKSRRAAEEIKTESGSDDVRMICVDLASRDSITSAAEQMKSAGIRIDVLVNNAGVYKSTREMSPDGIEMTLAVNFVAPFLLTGLLLPLMADDGDARIINVSSENYRTAKLSAPLGEADSSGKFAGNKAYANSKMMLVMFSRELATPRGGPRYHCDVRASRRCGTDVFREYPRWFASALNVFIPSPRMGPSRSCTWPHRPRWRR